MSIPPDDSGDRYVGDGVTVSHAFNFSIAVAGQLVARQDAFIMTYGTHYLITGIGDTDGGTVDWFTAPALGVAVTITRRETNSQETVYEVNEAYGPLKVQRDFDHLVRITQMLAEEIYRSAKFPIHFPNSTPFLPEPDVGKFLVWANTGSLVNVSGEPTEGGTFPDFDVIGDGVTDVTADLQAAWTAAATAQRTLYMPAGVYVVSTLAIQTDLRVIGDGKGATVIKRKDAAAGATFIVGINKTSFAFFDVGFDGNKANNTVQCPNVELDGCGNFQFVRCASNNAEGVDSGSGFYIHETSDLANSRQSIISQCDVRTNDFGGITLEEVTHILIDGNLVAGNSWGILAAFRFPPESELNKFVKIVNNECIANQNGIYITGFLQAASTAVDFIYGHSVPTSVGVEIANNNCNLNTLYGIVYQSYGGIISGNYCEKNGYGSGFAGGILANANGSLFTNNVISDCESYGIDGGWSTGCTFSNNQILSMGVTSGLGVTGINLGRGSICTGNNFSGNGNTNGGSHILMAGFDMDANLLGAELVSHYATVSGNVIASGHVNMAGITAFRGFDYLSIFDNQIAGCTVAYRLQGGASSVMNIKERGNVNWDVGAFPEIASSSTVVIPDVGDMFSITGTTNIDEIITLSQNELFEKVRFVAITNGGSGYTSAPTVAFTGGGGISAAGTAVLSGDGKVTGIEMSNNGVGYTSAPTVGFTGGGGAGAAGTAYVGCNNNHGREITLVFSDTLTVNDGSTLILSGNFSATANAVLKLIGVGGNWVQAN